MLFGLLVGVTVGGAEDVVITRRRGKKSVIGRSEKIKTEIPFKVLNLAGFSVGRHC